METSESTQITGNNLNPQQLMAAKAPNNRPLLIVAGAGTGKTKTLTNRIIHIVSTGVPRGKICALTFTNKAAREMKERVGAMTNDNNSRGNIAADNLNNYGHSDSESFIGTFHSLGARILRSEGHHFGRSPNFAIFDNDDSFRLIKKIIKGLNLKKEDAKPAYIYEKISEIKNGSAPMSEIEESIASEDQSAFKVFMIYEKELQKNNAFDFDDLIEKVVRLFKEKPEVLRRYQKKYPHILIDEYQDLNNEQYELIKLISKNSSGDRGSLSVVGDDQQMIYSWRGSNIEIFFGFEKDWPEAQTILLEENYRSSAYIISAASALIKNNRYRSAAWQNKNLWTKNPAGHQIKIVENFDDESEAERLASDIEEERIKDPDSEIAVLYRTNAQSRALEQALITREIPYRIFGGLKFYERREIKDIVAAIRYASNPKDEISRERLEKALYKAKFAEFMQVISDLKKLPPVEIINSFIKTTDYIDYLERNFTNSSERLENIAGLVSFASEFSDSSEFLERVALLQANDEIKNESGGLFKKSSSVKLMTIHLAKGLEFDKVYVAGVSEGLLPHLKSLGDEKNIEEERRLMYVAMTRAKEKLILSFYDLPSRFLSEIPGEFTEFDGARSLDDEERYITLD